MIGKRILLSFALLLLMACATGGGDVYHYENMDFGAIQTVAVMPFANLSRDMGAGERVRDIFITKLLATGGMYVVPVGEVAKTISALSIQTPTAPTTEQVIKLATALKSEAVITGVVREYGEVRAGTSAANVISLSLQMTEGQAGRVVWSASSTKGGITMKDRLLGGGGDPLNDVTVKAIDDLIDKLFL